MALPQWFSIAFTVADFVVQRVDRVGPVSFESPEKQPPEHAAAKTVDAPEMDMSVDEAPAAEVDQPSSAMGFRAGGGGEPSSGGDPGNEDDDDDDNGNGSAQARAGGGNDPTPAPPPEPPDDDDDDNGGGEQEHHDSTTVQCSFRSMRTADQPTHYDVERARDNAGEERPA